MVFFIFIIVSLSITAFITRVWLSYVTRLNIVDVPDTSRRLHTKPVPLLGGVAVTGSFLFSLLVLFLCVRFGVIDLPFSFALPAKTALLVVSGIALLLVGGVLDDKYRLPWYITILFPLAAVFLAMLGGVRIGDITNPFGGIANTQQAAWKIGGYTLWLPGDIITFFWLLGMTYTTKILDGLDGLATGVTAIGATAVVFLALFTRFYQPDIALIAAIFASVCVGFLLFNFYPAKIFLGEGGSVSLGFILGVLAILSGSKIMTTMLVVGVPAMDVAWAIARRIMRHKSFAAADRGHIHHRLLDIGFAHRGAVLFFYAVSALFGMAGLFVSSSSKLFLFALLAFFVMILLSVVHYVSMYVRFKK